MQRKKESPRHNNSKKIKRLFKYFQKGKESEIFNEKKNRTAWHVEGTKQKSSIL